MQLDELRKLTGGLKQAAEIIELVPVLKKMPVVEVGETLARLEDEYLIQVLELFSGKQQGLILAEMPIQRQLSLFHGMSRKRFALIFEHMPSDSRADLYQHFSAEEQASLLPYLSRDTRDDVTRLSAYPPETAGGIMSTDFATVQQHMSCEQAIDKVRSDAPSKRTVYYIYVLDRDQRMVGFITLKDLILAAPDSKVADFAKSEFVYAHVFDDRERVAETIEKYDLVAIPVLNNEKQLLGIVTHDEAIDVIRAEHTEDLEKFMGIASGGEFHYQETTVWQHFKKRVVWIVSLAILGILSGIIIHSYENALDALLILALYMPMVADTGGNSGSQAATVVIRALALGQVSLANWFRILWKEARVSLLIALCLGLIAFAKVLFLSWETDIPAAYSLTTVAFVISLALSLQVISSTIIGAGLPLLVKRFGGDPAVAAAPAITTVVDITGLLIYFGIATLFFAL
ncbi:MAG: magnesium transporter [Bacteroidia bacterium]